jgi:enterochelin esterase family protein
MEDCFSSSRPLCRRGLFPACFYLILSLAFLVLPAAAAPTRAQEPVEEMRYPLGPDSFRKEGVPRGKVSTFEWNDSKVYPGTERHYYLYVPAQYDAKKPAALMVFQDGHGYMREDADFRVPVVFDNLIHQGAMPVTIGVFVDPGIKPGAPKRDGKPGAPNRGIEYNTLSGDYANFLLTEILPAVSKEHPFTSDPEGHAICGSSSGGICAFTVAWQRPDQFRKVISHIGSFTNLSGGDAYPGMIRKDKEKKPLRVLLQDGSNDQDNVFGNWPLANRQMFAALKFRGYDAKFEYGQGGHSTNQGGAILPDSLRWLWRDYKLPKE